ncbi:GNAT family N-acetyltransferase [Flavobacteriaceae bacterium D16]|nr:GNAT family N-acetyltransferase [Flavobacteriaceae bacterium D16]
MSGHTLITLRRLTSEDAETMAQLANNKKIWDCARDLFPHPYTLEDAGAFIGRTEKEDPAHTFAIVNTKDQLCGVISLMPNEGVYRISSEIGYWIGEAYWGRGIATQAIAQITRYGFEELQLERIYAGVYEFNLASMKALEKNGYIKEGVMRNAVIKNGQILDDHRYAKIRNT